MLSIIICSKTKDISDFLKVNISNTVGVEFELVVIDNSNNEYSIFSAYNKGISLANGEFLCFMHEDISYKTPKWGVVVEEYLNKTEVGVLGVYGGHYIPSIPCYIGDTTLISGIMYYNNKLLSNINYFEDSKFVSVAALDGVWFCIRKELFENIKFDESYKGFHFYEMDICMQIHKLNKEVIVTKEILINHSSGGNINNNFLENQTRFFEKWSNHIPLVKGIFLSDDTKKLVDALCNELLWQRRLSVEYDKISTKYKQISNSYAYKLGKFLLRPMSFFKKIVK